MPAPQTKSNEIIQRAESLKKGLGTGEFVFRQIQREVEKVKEVNPAEGYMLEGIIFSKALDYERSSTAHKLSIQLDPSEANIWNYAASMSSMGFFREVSSIYDMLLDAGFSNARQVTSALHIALILSDSEKFFNIYNRFVLPEIDGDVFSEENIGVDIEIFRSHAELISKFLSEENVGQEELSKISDHVLELLESRFDGSASVTAKTANFYGSKLLHLIYFVERDVSQVHEMNMELMDRIAGDTDIDGWDKIVPAFEVDTEVEQPEEEHGAVCQ